MPQLIEVAKVSDIPAGAAFCVMAAGERVAIFNSNGNYFAISDACPHAGGPLSEGFVDENNVVTCPWHGWCFGLSREERANDGVERYPVVIDGEVVKLEIP